MSLHKLITARSSTFDMLATAGTIGLHMVSGPMVGFAIGYGLDYWLDTGPWCKLAFFLLGIVAGFKNVHDDTMRLLRKMQTEQDAAQQHGKPQARADNNDAKPDA